ncbi:MAG: flagellar motor switch protein FliN [Sphingomonadaceae bacterium]
MSFQPTGLDFLKDIEVRVSVELGQTDMTLRDAMALSTGSVVTLDRLTDELLDVMVNGKLIARGEVVAQGDRFGLRIVEIAGAEAPAMPPMPAATGSDAIAAMAPGEGGAA